MQRSMKVSEDREFMASDRWKCSKSPSGAHHWMIQGDLMTCKYCDLSKQVGTQHTGWSRPEAK